MTMGFFSTILDKLGLSKAEAATPAATAPAPTAAPAPASAAAPSMNRPVLTRVPPHSARPGATLARLAVRV